MAKKVTGLRQTAGTCRLGEPFAAHRAGAGSAGRDIMEFCKQFMRRPRGGEGSGRFAVIITVYSDRSFTFVMKTPPAAVLIRKAIGN